MRALSILEPGRLELVDVALPTLSEGWVRIRVSHVGICGTDYHIFEGSHPFVDYPRIIGHELSGRVSDPGSADFAVGDAVVVNPYLNCGHCPACRAGTPNCCETLNVLGVHTDGGMCEEIVVPATNVYSAHGLNSSDAAMVEFLAIGAHAVRRTEITANERTLVIGAGPIGLGTAIFARIAGAEVTLLDTAVEKIAAASALGFAAFELSDIDRPAFADRRGTGFDAVFDATGSLRSMNAAISYARHGGDLTLVGVTSGDLVWPNAEVHRRELTIRASRNATHADFLHVMSSMLRGLVPTTALATHATDLDRVVEDLPTWSKDRNGLIKAIVSI